MTNPHHEELNAQRDEKESRLVRDYYPRRPPVDGSMARQFAHDFEPSVADDKCGRCGLTFGDGLHT